MFSTKDINSAEGGSKYIRPGISEVTIVDEEGNSENPDKPYINMTFKLKGEDDEFKNSYRLYMNERAQKYSLEQIAHLATKCVTKEELDATTGKDVESYADALAKLLRNKSLRMKFSGQEYLKSDGTSIGVRTRIPLKYFAESISEGSEYPVVENTRLRYDKNNVYDFQPLPASETGEDLPTNPGNTEVSEDLPF